MSRGHMRLTSGTLGAWYVLSTSFHRWGSFVPWLTSKVWDVIEGGILFTGQDPEYGS